MPKNHLIVEVYQDHTQQWRWRMKRSGRVIADSGEGYTRKAKCEQTLTHLLATIAAGSIQITAGLRQVDVPSGPEKSGS